MSPREPLTGRALRLGTREVSDGSEAYVIAEIGANHEGRLETCLEMVRVAAELGVDCVKLQKRSNADLFTDAAFNAPYVSRHSFGSTYGEHRNAVEFGLAEYIEVRDLARSLGVEFAATAFDLQSLDFLLEIGVDFIKIASGDITNHGLISEAARGGVPVIVSTGAASMDDVMRAFHWLSAGVSPFALLQCTSGYPSAYEELNLRVIETYRREFPKTVIGFSSHEIGYSMTLAAYALGARVIERHFTLGRTRRGTDQALSLAPDGLRRLVRDLRRLKLAMGDGNKRPYESEEIAIRKQRKSPVAKYSLHAGHVLQESDIELRIPNDGIPAHQSALLIGKKLKRDLRRHDYIGWDDLYD